MTDKVMHSPTPWRFKQTNRNEIISANGTSLMADEQYYPWVPDEDDMKYIVKCVNSHDAVVAALETARACMWAECRDSKYQNAFKFIDAALAKAKATS